MEYKIRKQDGYDFTRFLNDISKFYNGKLGIQGNSKQYYLSFLSKNRQAEVLKIASSLLLDMLQRTDKLPAWITAANNITIKLQQSKREASRRVFGRPGDVNPVSEADQLKI